MVAIPFSTKEKAVEIANDTRFGLGASIWTQNIELAHDMMPRIEAGAVFINSIVKSDPRLPFGGIKNSGYGRELALEGVMEFMNIKTNWIE
jgi:succinate-semialdehyde dehydrogenase / glutarate-semialdehyde dehydrogenase